MGWMDGRTFCSVREIRMPLMKEANGSDGEVFRLADGVTPKQLEISDDLTPHDAKIVFQTMKDIWQFTYCQRQKKVIFYIKF